MSKPKTGLTLYEIGSLVVALLIIGGITIPSFLKALADLRGRECTHRLQLVADTIYELASENDVLPGERICSLFELNDRLMAKQDRAKHSLRIGVEPDCPDMGDFSVQMILAADGTIVLPSCSIGELPENVENHLHTLNDWHPAWQDELRQRAEARRQAAEQAKQSETQHPGLIDLGSSSK